MATKTMTESRTCSTCRGIVSEAIEDFIVLLTTRRYSPNTLSTYRWALDMMATYLCERNITSVSDVTTSILNAYQLHLVERGFKPATVGVHLRAIRGLFKMLDARHTIFINPATGLTLRHERTRIQWVPTEAQVWRLMAAPDTTTPRGLRDRALLELSYATGLRREELTTLTCSAFDGSDRTVRVLGKGSKERIVPVTGSACEWLKRYFSDSRPSYPGHELEAMWLGQNGPFTSAGITAVFYGASTKAGLMPIIRPHAMRRACATHLLANGAHPVAIQKLLGHASLGHLSQYLSVSIADMKRMHKNSKVGE